MQSTKFMRARRHVLRQPDVIERAGTLGLEIAKWGDVIRTANIKGD